MGIGSALRDNVPGSRGIFNRGKRSVLQEVVDLVNLRYVDKVNTDTLAGEAIQAMLAHLDPHSVPGRLPLNQRESAEAFAHSR